MICRQYFSSFEGQQWGFKDEFVHYLEGSERACIKDKVDSNLQMVKLGLPISDGTDSLALAILDDGASGVDALVMAECPQNNKSLCPAGVVPASRP